MKKRFFMLLLVCCLMFSGCSLLSGNSNEKNTENSNILDDNASITTLEQTGGTMVEGTSSINGLTSQNTTAGKPNAPVSTNNSNKIFATLYYQDKDGVLIPATRKFNKQDGIAKASINGLIDNSTNREQLAYYGLYPVLPQGTEVLGIDIRQGVAVIDFNSNFLNFNNEEEEKNAVASVIYTLTEFKTISSVSISINGQTQKKLKYNTDITGALSRDDVLINNGKLNVDNGSDKADIYMYKNINNKLPLLVPVSMEYGKVSDEYLPEKIIELLNSDLSDKNLETRIPSGVKINSSVLKSGVLTLDFSSKLKDYNDTSSEDEMLNQILYSMKQIYGVEKFKILIDGKEERLNDGTDLSKQLPLPGKINAVID